MRKETTLSILLEQIESLPWDHDLYLSELNINSLAMVLNEDDEELNESEQAIIAAVKKGLKYLFTIQTVQNVLEKLKQQIKNPNASQVIKALSYYHKNDAFIKING